ncbi:MAG: hypothetical protein HFJ42_06375 [Clostridia bacterium]|nr:hypothetical protein [Clostridia bacterium]
MEKKKKIIIGIVIILLVAIVLGIGVIKLLNREKKVITASEFVSRMQSKRYITQDVKSQFEEYDYIKEAYVASDRDYSYQIEFYELLDENYATMFYTTNKAIFESYKDNNSIETDVDGKNYSKYTLKVNEQYMLLSKIDNTVIYLKVDIKNKDNINKLIKELGY